MTEKEFILKALWELPQVKANGSYDEWVNAMSTHIEGWLKLHHEEYSETEFTKKVKTSIHCPESLMGMTLVLDKSLPDDRIEIHDQTGEVYVLMHLK